MTPNGLLKRALNINAVKLNGRGLAPLVEKAAEQAQWAADLHRRAVFAPPLAGLDNRARAREVDLSEGYALSVECDQRPDEARKLLEQILGPATVIVASGGTWTDARTGEVQDKLHLHWRLSEPATGGDLAQLKEARRLATRLVGGDATNVPLVHPIRWPGSWHRKGAPRMARIVEQTEHELHLADALDKLRLVQPSKAEAPKPGEAGEQRQDRQDDRPTHELIAGILSGESYHPNLIPLSSRLIGAGMIPGAAVKFLRQIMQAVPAERRDFRWQSRWDDIPRIVQTAEEKFGGSRDNAAAEEKPAAGLPFDGFEDLRVDIQKDSLIKNVVALNETSSWIALPSKGKSALLTDVAVHVAAGIDWRGYKAKKRAAVIYLAFERGDLVKRRLEAYKRKYGFKDLPIVVVTKPVDIMNPGCVAILVATIRAVAARYGIDVGLVILDTFAKAIALGGGDEDKAKDQNRVLGHLRLVQLETGVHFAIVGHTGKDEARGARGSNAHLGDVDMMVQISGDMVKTATITKANDQPEGALTSFTLESFELGRDEDGDAITTAIISETVPDRWSGPTGPRLSDQQRVALDLIQYAIDEAGERPPESNHIPKGTRAVKWDLACKYLDQGGITSSDDPRRIYDKVRDALKAKRAIGFWKPWIWIPDQARTNGPQGDRA